MKWRGGKLVQSGFLEVRDREPVQVLLELYSPRCDNSLPARQREMLCYFNIIAPLDCGDWK